MLNRGMRAQSSVSFSVAESGYPTSTKPLHLLVSIEEFLITPKLYPEAHGVKCRHRVPSRYMRYEPRIRSPNSKDGPSRDLCGGAAVVLRIPTKPAMHSNLNPGTVRCKAGDDSDLMSATMRRRRYGSLECAGLSGIICKLQISA
jgi:hypothetical protein